MKRERVGKIRVSGLSHPKLNDYTIITAWSRGQHPYSNLSPFFMRDENNHIFENIWQSHKVYEKVYEKKTFEWKWQEETHVTDGLPNEKWLEWHNALLKNPYAVRRPNGREKPLYAWYEDQKLDLIQSRRKIYIPKLQELYRRHHVYKKLLEMVRNGENILIVEPDGYPGGIDADIETLVELQERVELNGKYFPYGHGYVLALTILEDL